MESSEIPAPTVVGYQPLAALDETSLALATRVRAGLLGVAIAFVAIAACGALGLVIRTAVYGG